MDYDVIVVGAGPAGATVARQTALQGFKTILLEKDRLPRYKPCGGGLTPGVRRLLNFDYSDVVERVITGVTFQVGDHPPQTLYPPGFQLEMVSRERFDQRLAEQAVRCGAHLVEGVRVTSVEFQSDGARVRSQSGQSWKGAIVVGADGANSRLARTMGFHPDGAAVAMEGEILPDREVMVEELRDRVVLRFDERLHGYGWIFPKKSHWSVGVAVFPSVRPAERLGTAYERFKERFPFLRGAREVIRRGWTIPIHRRLHPVNTERLCLVGDAAALVDPATGEGIYYAISSGLLAAQAIQRDLPSLGALSSFYSQEIRKRLMKDFQSAAWLAAVFYWKPQWFLRIREFAEEFSAVVRKELVYREFIARVARQIGLGRTLLRAAPR